MREGWSFNWRQSDTGRKLWNATKIETSSQEAVTERRRGENRSIHILFIPIQGQSEAGRYPEKNKWSEQIQTKDGGMEMNISC